MNKEDIEFIVDAYFEKAIDFLDEEKYNFRKKKLKEKEYEDYFIGNIEDILDVFIDNSLSMNNSDYNSPGGKYENVVFPIKEKYFVFRNYGDKYDNYWEEEGFEVKKKERVITETYFEAI